MLPNFQLLNTNTHISTKNNNKKTADQQSLTEKKKNNKRTKIRVKVCTIYNNSNKTNRAAS